jgi:diacylglycerol kinase (ATP)
MAELLRGLPEGSLELRQANTYQDAEDYCREAVAQAVDDPEQRRNLLVMGGDGLMHLGLNAAAQSEVPVGMIPAGTGNDICRGLGIPLDPLKAARVIAEGFNHKVDLTLAMGSLAHGNSQRYVGSVVASGFDAKVGIRGASMSKAWGSLAYAVAALSELRTFEPLNYRLRVNGVERLVPAMFVAVANAGYYGGGMNVAPTASVTDGLLDVTIVHPVSRATLLRLLPRMFNGSFVADPAIERFTTKEIVIDGDGLIGVADGEALGQPPFGLVCAPAALSVYVPNPNPLAKRRRSKR